MLERKILSKSMHTTGSIIKCILKLAICLAIVLFHNFYIFSYSADNASLNSVSIFEYNSIVNNIGHKYADLITLIFGRASYLFGIIPITLLMQKEQRNKYRLLCSISFTNST